MIFANRYSQIEPLLARCVGLRKKGVVGGALLTSHAPEPDDMDERACELLDVVRTGIPLSQKQAQEVIWLIDFLAVAMPDNGENAWDADILKIASTLRQEYAKAFGKKSYNR